MTHNYIIGNRNGILVAFLLTICTSALFADDPSVQSWDNLQQLQVGQKIEVVQMDYKSRKGTFLAYSEEAISLRIKSEEIGIRREEVLRVNSREKSTRVRNALIGMAVGGAAGAVLVGVLHNLFEDSQNAPAATASLLGLGAGVGVGVGAAFPHYQTIYRGTRKRGGDAH